MSKRVARVEVTSSKEFKTWVEDFRVTVKKLDDLMARIPKSILEVTAAAGQEEKPSDS